MGSHGHSRSLEIAATNRSSTYEFLLAFHSNYLAPFLRFSETLVENRHLNLPHLYLAPPLGVTQLEFHLGFLASVNYRVPGL